VIAILGAGKIGLRVAASLSKTHTVRASTQSPERFENIARSGATPVLASLGDPKSVNNLIKDCQVLLFSVAAKRKNYDFIYGPALDEVIEAIKIQGPDTRLIFISSTAVFDQYDHGELVTETSKSRPLSENAKELANAEQKVRDQLQDRGQILRLAGLYSSQRGPFHYVTPKLKDRIPLRGQGGKLLNLIHDEDAARLVEAMILDSTLHSILGADGQSHTRAECYGRFARFMGFPEPRFADQSTGISGRRVRPSSLPIALNHHHFKESLRDFTAR
jgi:nucleoside-diphosphate-sugar epimerase